MRAFEGSVATPLMALVTAVVAVVVTAACGSGGVKQSYHVRRRRLVHFDALGVEV